MNVVATVVMVSMVTVSMVTRWFFIIHLFNLFQRVATDLEFPIFTYI